MINPIISSKLISFGYVTFLAPMLWATGLIYWKEGQRMQAGWLGYFRPTANIPPSASRSFNLEPLFWLMGILVLQARIHVRTVCSTKVYAD